MQHSSVGWRADGLVVVTTSNYLSTRHFSYRIFSQTTGRGAVFEVCGIRLASSAAYSAHAAIWSGMQTRCVTVSVGRRRFSRVPLTVVERGRPAREEGDSVLG